MSKLQGDKFLAKYRLYVIWHENHPHYSFAFYSKLLGQKESPHSFQKLKQLAIQLLQKGEVTFAAIYTNNLINNHLVGKFDANGQYVPVSSEQPDIPPAFKPPVQNQKTSGFQSNYQPRPKQVIDEDEVISQAFKRVEQKQVNLNTEERRLLWIQSKIKSESLGYGSPEYWYARAILDL